MGPRIARVGGGGEDDGCGAVSSSHADELDGLLGLLLVQVEVVRVTMGFRFDMVSGDQRREVLVWWRRLPQPAATATFMQTAWRGGPIR